MDGRRGGAVELPIKKAEAMHGAVWMKYRDEQNMKVKIQKDLEDI